MRAGSLIAFMRSAIVVTVSLGLVIAPATPALAATATAPKTLGDIKSASRFRAEAARYDQAIKAIGSIGSMSLRTPADLSSADAIIRKYGPSLKLLTSKLVTLAYDDPTFTLAIAKNFANERLAKDFAGKLMGDRRYVEQLNGAKALEKRMVEFTNVNGALLQKASENLRISTARITGKSSGVQPRYLPALSATQWYTLIVIVLLVAAITFPALAIGAAIYASLIVPGAAAAFLTSPLTVAFAAYFTWAAGYMIIDALDGEDPPPANSSTGQDSAAVAACIDAAIARNEQCLEGANSGTAAERLLVQLGCASNLAAEQAFCSLADVF